MSRRCSSTSTVGDSPVVPTMTMPAVPCATCKSISLRSAGRSSAPPCRIGVAIATKLPLSIEEEPKKSDILPESPGKLRINSRVARSRRRGRPNSTRVSARQLRRPGPRGSHRSNALYHARPLAFLQALLESDHDQRLAEALQQLIA